MKNIKIAIVDSGVNKRHPVFKNSNIIGYSLNFQNDKIVKSSEFDDEIGHGTAVFYLINKLVSEIGIASEIYITNVKIYNAESDIDQEQFESILNYLYENCEFDIINLSLGITNCGSTYHMQNICNNLHEKGTIIVSAFDNDGAVSFPAALNNVIGVDANETIATIKDFEYIENSIVNVIGKLMNQKVAWVKPEYNIVKGNSFTCCYVTAKIIEMLKNDSIINLQSICNVKHKLPNNNVCQLNYSIRKAAIFPFNKEIHSIARYQDLLEFEVMDYYTARITGNVGKKICDIIENSDNKKTIKNIDSIEWDNIDTLIIGHLEELSILAKKNYKKYLLETAMMLKKNIYSFDCVDEYIEKDRQNSLNIFTPRIDNSDIPFRFGKLYKINKPILSIIGTSSKQGKFTLQLYLRKILLEAGYKVGQIGTEPSSLLFGIDKVFHCGYNSQANLGISNIFTLINQFLWDISEDDVDIILAGSQSSFLAYNESNVKMFPTYHRIYFEALRPDATIICINPFDDLNFVKRIINVAEGISGGSVLGAVCFPKDFDDNWKGKLGNRVHLSNEKELQLKILYKENLNLDLYMLDKEDDLFNLTEKCLLFFEK